MTLFMRDQINREEGFKEGFQEGFKEGYEESVHNRSVEIAKKMIELNKHTLQDIAEVTGLKLEEIEVLANLQPM